MNFRFDANQAYQLQAVAAIADLFDGQPPVQAELGLFAGAVANRLDLSDEALLANLQAVQEANGLSPDTELLRLGDTVLTAEGEQRVEFMNFSAEMETGTGKTYVYLRTAIELHRRYGLRKYIIVVPSIAIREGVLKTLQITQAHFCDLYANAPYRFYAYDSGNLSQVRQFALSDSVEFMVMTIDSFNKASNVIRQSTDRLAGETPIHLVQATRPILILDEPQNMESELSVKALAALKPLCALRYSATHRNAYNLVYRLTPYQAYREGLVKRIEVAGITQEADANRIFLRLDGIATQKTRVTARLAVHKLMKDGTVKERAVTVRAGECLDAKTGRPEYRDYTIYEINPAGGFVTFTNGVELSLGQSQGADRAAVFREQIRYTIEEHLHKQARLKDQGLKVLSLFFIDHVDNYAREDGLIRRLFDQAFDELKRHPRHAAEWSAKRADEVRGAYFAKRKRRDGEELLDTTGKSKADEEAFDLIMRNKERLLSFEEPVSFIFSHSALREGWDNPNIFQICTLNQTASEVRKRQEIGRGVRLAVNQAGERVHDERLNVLTVVANESYEEYVERLQAETEAEFGAAGVPPAPTDARKRRASRRKDAVLKDEDFVRLWDAICQKTRYAVQIDTAKLLTDVRVDIDKLTVTTPRIAVTKVQVDVGDRDEFSARQLTSTQSVSAAPHEAGALPNIVDLMAHLMEFTTPPVRLTRGTLLEVYKSALDPAAALANPHGYAAEAVRIIKRHLASQLVSGVKYERINEFYEMSRFDPEIEGWQTAFMPAQKSMYDQVQYDSEIERKFVEEMDKRDDIKLYVKLPAWFTVSTPVGKYNPDWAIVMVERDAHGESTGEHTYLVRETKAAGFPDGARDDERWKVDCGRAHFRELDVDFRVVSVAADLP